MSSYGMELVAHYQATPALYLTLHLISPHNFQHLQAIILMVESVGIRIVIQVVPTLTLHFWNYTLSDITGEIV